MCQKDTLELSYIQPVQKASHSSIQHLQFAYFMTKSSCSYIILSQKAVLDKSTTC